MARRGKQTSGRELEERVPLQLDRIPDNAIDLGNGSYELPSAADLLLAKTGPGTWFARKRPEERELQKAIAGAVNLRKAQKRGAVERSKPFVEKRKLLYALWVKRQPIEKKAFCEELETLDRKDLRTGSAAIVGFANLKYHLDRAIEENQGKSG